MECRPERGGVVCVRVWCVGCSLYVPHTVFPLESFGSAVTKGGGDLYLYTPLQICVDNGLNVTMDTISG